LKEEKYAKSAEIVIESEHIKDKMTGERPLHILHGKCRHTAHRSSSPTATTFTRDRG
jgi:hypothetical protein